jgi:hypothetical protein
MSVSQITVEPPSEELLWRLNSRVHPVCEMVSRGSLLQAVYSVPDSHLNWFCSHCIDLGIRTSRIDGRMSLLEQLAADDLEE